MEEAEEREEEDDERKYGEKKGVRRGRDVKVLIRGRDDAGWAVCTVGFTGMVG
jgi:hypothetical protein